MPAFLLWYSALAIAALMSGLWVASLIRRDASIVDIFWGLGFVLVAWICAAVAPNPGPRVWLMTALVTLWGLRLAGYLAWRNLGKPEDYRYRALRDKYPGSFWIISLPLVFGLQGLVMWIVSLPIQAAAAGTSAVGWLDFLGVLVWAAGLAFEGIGDWQLARFKQRPENRGKVFDGGLWHYTRHPNYFGDFLIWWGIYLVAAASGNAWTIISPLLMSFLLMRVSGVTLLEKSLKTRTEGYADYVNRTSAFFPWPPRNGASA